MDKQTAERSELSCSWSNIMMLPARIEVGAL